MKKKLTKGVEQALKKIRVSYDKEVEKEKKDFSWTSQEVYLGIKLNYIRGVLEGLKFSNKSGEQGHIMANIISGTIAGKR